MLAYELLAHLRHLSLAGRDASGRLEWIGTSRDWLQVEKEKISLNLTPDEKEAYDMLVKLNDFNGMFTFGYVIGQEHAVKEVMDFIS